MIVNTGDGNLAEIAALNSDYNMWLYNGFDCTITVECFNKIWPQVQASPAAKKTYLYELMQLAPALEMMGRGLRVDHDAIAALKAGLIPKMRVLEDLLDELAMEIWAKPLNWKSFLQLTRFFYGVLGIDPIKKFDKGVWKVTIDREALEKIHEQYPRAKVFTTILLSLRDYKKDMEVLESILDEDGRLRCSYNVAGTETGRWSSSASPFTTGCNLQNITNELRTIFIPDKGKILFNADLDQAESVAVAYLSGDENYIKACNSGDLHTTVTRMIWPELDWSDDSKHNKAVAKKLYFRHFSYRDLCKRAGHGSNYLLGPHSLARHLHLPLRYATRFQLLYYGGEIKYSTLERWHHQDPEGGFDSLLEGGVIVGASPKGYEDQRIVIIEGAFPGIRAWHTITATELETSGYLETPLNRGRWFWGRLTDQTTLREAVAFRPQSLVSDILTRGLHKVWLELEPHVNILANGHDAILGQIDEDKVDKYLPLVLDCMVQPVKIGGRTMTIGVSAAIGKNAAKFNSDPREGLVNLSGLRDWAPSK